MSEVFKVFKTKASPPEQVIEKLRDLLERAEAGEIDSFGYATISPTGEIYTGSVWETHWWLLLGAVSHLSWRMNQSTARSGE